MTLPPRPHDGPPDDDRLLQRWAFLHALVTLSALAAALAVDDALPLLVGGASILGLAVRFRGRWTPRGGFGAGNTVTLVRLLAVVYLTVAGGGLPPLAILSVVLVVLAGDGLDGALARRREEASVFGEYFDKETDALLLLLLCVLLVLTGRLGAWILLAGALRYAFVVTTFLSLPRVRKEQKSGFARIVFVVTVFALLFAFLPVPALYVPVAIGATGLLVVSFARSFWTLFAAA